MGNIVDKCLWESIVSEIGGKHSWQMSVRIYCVRNWWETLLTNVCQNLLCQKLVGNTVDKCLSESILSEIDGKHCWQMSVRIYCVRNWWETLLTNVCQNLLCQKLVGNTVDKCLSESIMSEVDGKHCWQMSVRIFVFVHNYCTYFSCTLKSLIVFVQYKLYWPAWNSLCTNVPQDFWICEQSIS